MMRTFRRRPSRSRRHALPSRDAAVPAPPSLPATAPPRARSAVWRLEYALLAGIGALITAFAFAFFYFDVNVAELNKYGYVGLFAVSLISAASIVLPMPGAAAIAGAGALLDPVLGVPVPLLVALVASPAEAIGELTGYAAGYGGSPLFRDRPFYPRIRDWMERRGVLTMFVLSAFPNPFVDVAGVTAGAVRMPVAHFFAGVLPGKFIKNCYLSAGGLVGAELVRRLFG
jgi:membrane protein YqaA with SNARE-associated domain